MNRPTENEGERPDSDEAEQRENTETEGGQDETVDIELQSTFHRTAAEGEVRLRREMGDLISTGTLGGMDVSLGILALLLVQDATGSAMLASLAFSIGFIALLLGRSELYTENFLVPIAAIVSGSGTAWQLARLWTVTLVMNLLGALILAGLIAVAFPHLAGTALDVALEYPDVPAVRAATLGLLAGITITFMTWTVQAAHSELGRLVAVVVAAFLLAAGDMHHVVVVSGEMFVAILMGGAPFGAVDWLRVAGLATVTNAIGGLVLVTLLRFAQVGPEVIESERVRRRWRDT